MLTLMSMKRVELQMKLSLVLILERKSDMAKREQLAINILYGQLIINWVQARIATTPIGGIIICGCDKKE